MAEVVLTQKASLIGLSHELAIDSAGIAADVGFDIDRRARRALERRGYEPVGRKARQFQPGWLNERDLVIAMDKSHVRWLEKRAPEGALADVRLLLSYPTDRSRRAGSEEITDPYYGDAAEFDSCLGLIQAGCTALLAELFPDLGRN